MNNDLETPAQIVDSGEFSVRVPLKFQYCQLRTQSSISTPPKELILLLHGFQENGARILKKIGPAFNPLGQDLVIIAPSAPFLIPIKTPQGYKPGYSWYFYDTQSRHYVVDRECALEYLTAGLQKLQVYDLPKRIIGFSQGGFLAPFVAENLPGVRQVIGINCEFRVDEMNFSDNSKFPPRYRIDAIHSEKDETCPIEAAKKSFMVLKKKGCEGEFHEIPEAKHAISVGTIEALRALVQR